MSGATGKEEILTKSLESLEKAMADLCELTGEDKALALNQALFGEGSDFCERLLELVPRVFNLYLQLSRGMAEALLAMDEDRRRKLLASYLSVMDGEKLGRAINSSCRTMIRIHEENPDIFAEGRRDFYLDLLDSLDSGLLRKGILSYADSWTRLQGEVVDRLVSDAVLLANVLGATAPLANDMLRLLSRAFSSLDMPSEILASAVFNILSEIDTEQLGAVINGFTAMIKGLHEGNLLLGRDEPRLRSVISRFSEGLLAHVDKEQAAMAVLALAEDTETVISVMGDILYRDPELLVLSTAAMLSSIHALLRGATDAVAAVAQLSDSSLDLLAGEIDDGLDPKSAAKLLNALLSLEDRLLDARPGLPADFAGGFVSTLDTELLSRVLLRYASSITPVMFEELEITPEKVGALMSSGLSAYNRAAADDPGAAADALSRALGEIEPAEMRRASEHILVSFATAVGERPEILRALIRPAASAAWKMIKNYAGVIGKRLGGRVPRSGLRGY